MQAYKKEPISKEKYIYVSEYHRFSTDTILLADFSMPKPNELCADIGTGCGMIPMLWCVRSKMKKAYGIEIQEDAAQMAQESVKLNGFEEKLEIITADVKELKDERLKELHLVSCNPPYKPIGSGIRSEETAEDVARHEISCSIEDVAKAASMFLRFGGRLCVCQRPERLCDVMEAFRKYGIEPKRLRMVQQRKDKKPFLFLLEGKKGGKPYLNVEPTLFVEDNNNFSEEMMKIYGDYKNSPEITGRK